ncbi:MAG: META domain-containing protein [Methanolinea sp.]|jgi:heat shock protein HslJ|nr:META domain-containing protein [Methanolinea sp.]
MKSLPASILACLLVLAVLWSGCATRSIEPGHENTTGTLTPVSTRVYEENTSDLSGITWELVSYDSGRLAQESVIPESVITARFEHDGVVYGTSGCNQYFARYEATSPRLSIETPAHTRDVCITPTGVLSQESVYLVDLGKVSSYRVEGVILSLSDSKGRAVLIFRKGIMPVDAGQISWKTWYLTSYRDDQDVMATLPEEVLVTARFFRGTLSGIAGCNSYRASYQEHGAAIAIGVPAATDMKCGNETVMEQEQSFFSGLKGVAAYVTGEDSLLLVDSRGEALMEFYSFRE